MKALIKLEEITLVLLALYLFLSLDYAWWWFPVLSFVPDVSLAGYLFGQRASALTFNVIHHRALAVMLYLAGSLIRFPGLQLAGVVMLGHSSFDRALGFELQK